MNIIIEAREIHSCRNQIGYFFIKQEFFYLRTIHIHNKSVLLYIDDTLILLVVLMRGEEKKFIGSSNTVNEK